VTLDFFFFCQRRASRECYIGRRMLNFTLFAGLCIGAQSTLEAFGHAGVPHIGVTIALAALIWMEIAIRIRRLHDMDRPGWHLLLLGVPVS
jgi:uncharacterized membrane protein YhaH (DUF805 family)